jgi:thymidylate synthase
MTIPSYYNVDLAQLDLMKQVLENGNEVSTRGTISRELSPCFFTITNPLGRITTLSKRNWNYPAALGELAWHLSGSNSVGFISTYLKQWKNYSEDGVHILGSCYGYKIFHSSSRSPSQWSCLIDLFKKDIYTRRGVLDLYSSEEGLSSSIPDVACTCTLQFIVRSGRVDLFVNMRSNDLIWGLPYDIFFFTFLQELLAKELNLKLGKYFHFAGSLHIYDKHLSLAKDILNNNSGKNLSDNSMPEMPKAQLSEFLRREKDIRAGKMVRADILQLNLDSYWKNLLLSIEAFIKQSSDRSSAQ